MDEEDDEDEFTCTVCGCKQDVSELCDNCSGPTCRVCFDCCECDWRTDEEREEEHETYIADLEYHRLKEFEEERL